MSNSNTAKSLLVTFGAVLALAGCGNGADRVASPGEGAFPPAPPPVTPPPVTPPPTTPPPTSGPAADCATGFVNAGLVKDGTMRACRLPEVITGNLVVPKRDGTVYVISGRVAVGVDLGGDSKAPRAGGAKGVLTVEPGVTLIGNSGRDYLVVNRGSQILAEGTKDAPIVFTARSRFEGTSPADAKGLWGGVVLVGRAPINQCPGTTVSGTPQCESTIEGTDALYGGNDTNDSSGSLRYVRVMHSGYELAPNNELNGITLGGVGSGTTFEYVQVHNSSDDGIEWFGGSANGRYIVVTGADDDSLDTDHGWNGALQFGIVMQDKSGDRANEWSSINRQPYSNPKVANFTFIANNTNGRAIFELNQGTQAEVYNSVLTRPAGGTGQADLCLRIDPANADTAAKFQSVYMSCPRPWDPADARVQAAFNAGANNTSNGTSTLQNLFINGANESGVTAFANLSAVNSFFRNVTYIGGVKDASDTWWQGWTCGLTADKPC